MSKRTGIMLCYPLEETRVQNKIRGCQWSWPVFVQPKLDGERCRAKDGNFLISSEGNSFNHTVPHIRTAYQELCINLGFCPELDGELYKHEMSFEDIHSRVSTSRLAPHEDYKSIKFYIFDLIDENLEQINRFRYLHHIYKRVEHHWPFELVKTFPAYNMSEVMDYFKTYNDLRYEGIIVREANNLYVRKRTPYVLKFKPKKIDEYIIVGVQEEISINGILKNTLGSIICEKDGQRFSTGSGTLTNEQKKDLWERRFDLPGKYCKVWYQSITTDKKVPRFVSKIEIVDKPTEFNPLLEI